MGWRERLATIRANSATDVLLEALPGAPVVTLDSAATLIGRTFKPANGAIQRLVEEGILRQVTIGRRNRAFEAPELIEAVTAPERQRYCRHSNEQTSPPSSAATTRRRTFAVTIDNLTATTWGSGHKPGSLTQWFVCQSRLGSSGSTPPIWSLDRVSKDG
jgi:hypothetical protein